MVLPRSTRAAVVAVLLGLAASACGQEPALTASRGPQAHPLEGTVGLLTQTERCLTLDDSHALVWPRGTSLGDDGTSVTSPDGNLVAVGEELMFAGEYGAPLADSGGDDLAQAVQECVDQGGLDGWIVVHSF